MADVIEVYALGAGNKPPPGVRWIARITWRVGTALYGFTEFRDLGAYIDRYPTWPISEIIITPADEPSEAA